MAKRKAKAKAGARPLGRAKVGSGRAGTRATKAPAPKRPATATSRPQAARASATRPEVRPLRDRVLVRRAETPEGKVGRLYVPDSAREKPLEAVVVAIGSGRTLKNGTRAPLQLAPGNRVLIGKWSGSEVKLNGEDYLILQEDEILAILG